MELRVVAFLSVAAVLILTVYGCRGLARGGPEKQAVENFRSTVFKSQATVVKPLETRGGSSETKYSMAAEADILKNLERARIAAMKGKEKG